MSKAQAQRLSASRDVPMQRELPTQVENEQALLGAIMMSNDILDNLPSAFEDRHFEEPLHAEIFREMKRLQAAGKKCSPVTIRTAVTGAPDMVGGLTFGSYLAAMLRDAPTVHGAIDIAEAIMDGENRRRLRGLSQKLESIAFEHELEIPDNIKAIEEQLASIRMERDGKAADDEDITDQYLQMITGSYEHADCEGVPVEFPEIQRVLSDTMLRRGRMYGLLSSSGEGKSSLMLQIAHTALMAGHPVLILSFDQSELECLAQMAAQNVGVEFRSQMQNTPNKPMLSQNQIDTAYGFVRKIKRLPFSVKDCETRDTAEKLETYIDQFLKRKANGKTPLFIVDHIRAIKPEGQADEGTKALLIAQKLKSTFKKRNAAGLIIQQRSGSGMKRDNPRPIADDLYGGEAARQPFDTIFYLYRAEMHMNRQIATAKDAQEQDRIRSRFRHAFGEDLEGKAEIGAIKARFSNPNTRGILDFDAPYTKYTSRRQDDRGLFE